MIKLSELIQMYNDPDYGPVIVCSDYEEFDALQDFLVEVKDVEDIYYRESEQNYVMYVTSKGFDELVLIVAEFVAKG